MDCILEGVSVMAVAKRKTTATAEPVKAKAPKKKAVRKTAPKLATTTRPKARRTTKKTSAESPVADPAVMQREVELLAYRLWEERGCPEGSGFGDWTQAEQQILASRAA